MILVIFVKLVRFVVNEILLQNTNYLYFST